MQRKTSEETALQGGLLKKDYENASGMNILTHDHPIFSGIAKAEPEFGQQSELIFLEVDGLPLTDQMEIDRERFRNDLRRNVIPKNIKPLAWSWIYPYNKEQPMQKVSVVNEYWPDFGGHVLNMGSIGWFNVLRRNDEKATKIVDNSVRYMMESSSAKKLTK